MWNNICVECCVEFCNKVRKEGSNCAAVMFSPALFMTAEKFISNKDIILERKFYAEQKLF